MSREQEELVAKVKELMQRKYGSTDQNALRKLFDEYDRNGDGKIDKRELQSMLADAGVGSSLTRGMWVKGVVRAIDQNDDEVIDWAELSKVIS
jgi:Ca2+-binding EF-hand superfamily protein